MSEQNMIFDLDAYLTELRPKIDAALQQRLPPPGAEDPLRLREAIACALLEGGKRLRPCLTVAACQAVSGTVEEALGAACASEMIHAYSLVHDDLPAMDNDATRRGRPACHKQFGASAAILAGDALCTLAFEILAAEGQVPERAPRIARAIFELARAAGVRGMVGGQAMDLALKQGQPSFEKLELCQAGKTAALFSACTAMGGIVGGGSDEQVDLLRSCGFDLGLAFQHADDLKDAELTPHRDRSYLRALDLTGRALRTAEHLGASAAPLISLATWVETRVKKAKADEPPLQS